MAWNDLAPNQMVSFNDIQGSGFGLKEGVTAISTDECITRDEALTMYYVNPYAVAPYNSNQLIPKSSLVGSGIAINLCYDVSDSSTACNYCINPPPPPPPDITGPLSFPSGFNNSVFAIAVQPNGRILVGGSFTMFQGLTVPCLLRLLPNGQFDWEFEVQSITYDNLPVSILGIILRNDGKIIVNGYFSKYGDTDTAGIMILNPDGSLNNSCQALIRKPVKVIKDQGDNLIVTAAINSSMVSSPSNYKVVKLNPDLSYNSGWPFYADTVPGLFELDEPNNIIYIVESDYESSPGILDPSVQVFRIVAYNYSTKAYISQSQTFNKAVRDIKKLSNNKIIVVGEFTNYNGQTTNQIVVLNLDFTVDTLFTNGFSQNISGAIPVASIILVQSNGKIIIGGSRSLSLTSQSLFSAPFRYFGGVSSNSIVRLNADYTRDNTFNVGTGFGLAGDINEATGQFPNVYALAAQYGTYGSGEFNLLIGGYIQKYNGADIPYFVSTDISGSKNSL